MGFWTPIAIVGGSSLVTGSIITKAATTKGLKNAIKTLLTGTSLALFKNSGKILKYSSLGFAIGLVLDKIINHSRRKNADKAVYLK